MNARAWWNGAGYACAALVIASPALLLWQAVR